MGLDVARALRHVTAVVDDARSGLSLRQRMLDGSAALAAALRADARSLFVMDRSGRARDLSELGFLIGRPSRLREYVEHYRALDPMGAAAGTTFDRAVLLSDFAPRFGADAFTADFLARDDIRYVAGNSGRLPDDLTLVCAFHRGASKVGDFGPAERQLLGLAMRPLARAAFGALLREKAEQLARSAGAPRRSEGRGALVLDALGDIAHADPDALALLHDPSVRGALEALADDAERLAASPIGAQVTRRRPLTGGRELHVHLACFALAGGERGVLAALSAVAPRPPLERRLDASGLTPREREVAGLAVEGLSNAEIAARLGLSPATVSVHMTRIFRKTGAAGRVALTRWFHER